MKTYLDLKQRAQAKLDEAKGINNKAEAEDRALSDEEQRQFDASMAEFDSLTQRADRHAKLRGLAEDIAKAPVVMANDEPDTRISNMVEPEDKLMATGGFRTFGHFCRDLIEDARVGGHRSEALDTYARAMKRTAGYMEEGDLSQGGYLVPVEFSKNLLEKSLEDSIVRPRATVIPMASNRIEIPADVDEDHSSNYFGGITIYRPAEKGQKTASNPTVSKVALTLHKLVGLVHVTDELMEDSVAALDAWLTRKFTQAISFVEDDDFLSGDGSGKALGAFNAANPSIVTVTAVSGQGANTIIAENIIGMWARMYSAGKKRAVWVANPETFPQLATMSLAVGTGGVPIWMPAGGLAAAPYETLMGRPLLYSEKMQALGTAGDIGLADFSQYIIGQKGGVQVASSIHLKFDYDETSFRFVLRYDGQPTWKKYLTPKRGSATLSPFIVLNSTRT
ncbi:MAG: phage major capsid protein [Candidatus Pacebacteria bacterium]|nr:phage major capsid protein [Candidatus Paceibacterota bacterium]